MRDHRGRLPKMRRASISVQQVGRGQLRSLRCEGYAGDAPQVDKFSSLPLGVFRVAVDTERSLTASPIARVETTTTRISQTPGDRSRRDPAPRFDRLATGVVSL